MSNVFKLLCLFLFPLFALKAEIHLNQFPEKEPSQKMFAVIYQGYLKPGRENEYQEAWSKVAQYFIEYRGAIGSCLHKTSEGLWVAYSRWPDKKTRDNSWPGENAPSEELPPEIRNAVLTIKDCLDSDRKIPDLCMEVVSDLLLSTNSAESNFTLSPEQERIMNLVYEEVEIAIQEGNPPFAAIITDSENNILAKQLAIAHAEIEAIQLACKTLGKKKLDGCILYANAESCGMCSTAIIKSGISEVFYGAPHEKGSNPDVHLLEINKKATPQLKVYGGFMKDKFIEQIDRGRSQTLIGEEMLQTNQKNRSQEPKPPFPYLVEEINYGNSEISLSGTLTLPRTIGPFPAVILIHGSSALDRDETILGHKPFLVLSDHFTRHGIAVLRFDKRGVGKSTGNYDNATIEDFCDDVAKGIEYLKSRPEIIRNQIGLVGHSEGGIVAPMLAVKSNDVAFIVLMAGTGVNGEEIFCEQGRLLHRGNGVDEEMIAIDTQIRKIFTGIVKKETNRDMAKEQIHVALAKFLSGLTEEQKIWVKIHSVLTEELIKRFNSPWGHFYFPYEPSTALRHITIPTLALNGDLDLVVSPKQNLPFIEEALKKAGNKDYAIIELPKLNHAFQTCEIGSWDEYEQTEETIAPSVLSVMTDWILERTTKINERR